ncbi:galactose oxidase-like domain-containing protein [Ideonella alba]|uniref:DUF1929 domain-containing protein n=1 Tax=Ideonella alba TaxID=2824118 RepID=A0A940Y852_9BURK|nr:galactose oxidase-like domain-containing protein [Ideonella alba]MBQ0931642.1 DUF1929 domain-containing protein [Ideonella alba]
MPPRLDGPVDWGPGPGWPKALGVQTPVLRPFAVPIGPPDAHLKGVFGPAFAWSLIPLHSVLLADGRVLSFGTGPDGLQGALMNYAVWDPAQGTGETSMQLLPNSTGTDIFCAGQTLLPGSGDVLLVGGDRTVKGVRNYGNNDVNRFSPLNNSLTKESPMVWQRWYATLLTNTKGEQVALGGLIDRAYNFDDGTSTVASHASTPEVYLSGGGWRTLYAATSDLAYGSISSSWSYPRAWLAPDGRIAILTPKGEIYALDTEAGGTLERTLASGLGAGRHILPAVMYQPGKVLSLRVGGVAKLVDLNVTPPVVSATANLSLERQYGNATVLPNGQVFVNGGSSTGNSLAGAAYHSETWDPATGTWTTTASAAKPRLYHSTAMLLPDATVLTNGGGAPGPVNNLNGEIYYPPYLYHPDGSGRPARRPVIASAPQAGTWGQAQQLEMADPRPVARLTLVRFGAVTHAFHSDQRFQELSFAQRGKRLSYQLPASAAVAPPGFYMLFALDAAGVPSMAKVIRIG